MMGISAPHSETMVYELGGIYPQVLIIEMELPVEQLSGFMNPE